MDEFMLVDSVEEVSQMEVEKVEERDSGVVRWEEFMPKMIRVLLVETDDSTRHIIAALLRKCNYKVAAVSDGLKAWEILKRRHNNIDLILTEVDLPSISGYALLTLIMEHDSCRNIPVIMMSSTDSMSTVFQCMLKGGADFLIKPVRRNELQNLWQHVWRRISQANKGASVQNISGDDCNAEASSKNGATRICSDDNISYSTQRSEPTKKASNSQGSSQMRHHGVSNLSGNEVHPHDKGLILGEHTEQERSTRFQSSEEPYGDDTFASTFRVEQEGSSGRMAEYEKIEVARCVNMDDMLNGEHEDTKQAIDLIGTIDNHCECTIGEEQQSSSAAPQLELSLRRSNDSDKQRSDGKQKLNHSNASAFSSYSTSKKLRYSFPSIDSSDEENRSTVMTDPASVVPQAPPPPAAHASMSSPQASQGAIGLEHSEFDETSNNEEKLTSVNQQRHAIASQSANSTFCSQGNDNPRSTHHQNPLREAALAKFRLKRKERCYEKKVRYQSRKRLAEQRPRVKGQFVRQVQTDQPLDDGG